MKRYKHVGVTAIYLQPQLLLSNIKHFYNRHTCNVKSTACHGHRSICSRSSALYHCPIQSDCSSECQGRGHISYSTTCYCSGVSKVCEGSHKVQVSAMYSCNIIAVLIGPNSCSTQESYTSAATEVWFNNPV